MNGPVVAGPGGLLLQLVGRLLVTEHRAELVSGLVLDFVKFLELKEDLVNGLVFGAGVLLSRLLIIVEG